MSSSASAKVEPRNPSEIIQIQASTKAASLPKKKLNPAATEFVSSRSESEASSISDETEIVEEHGHSDINRNYKVHKGTPAMNSSSGEGQNQAIYHNQSTYGWESPQGVIPPSHYHPHPPHMTAVYVPMHPNANSPTSADRDASASEQTTANNPTNETPSSGNETTSTAPRPRPDASPVPHHPMPSYPGWGPAAYPVYHIYHPDGMERAASPPAVFPAGASPPLAPGFISVPMHGHHPGMGGGGEPGSPPAHPAMMYGSSPLPSLGSSPPHAGPHYVYMPHHMHHPGIGGGPVLGLDIATNRFSSMSMDTLPSDGSGMGGGSVNGGSPTRKEGGTRASGRIARSHRAGGAYNPSDFAFKEEFDKEDGGRTAVMIRNIPNKYSQEVMLALLESSGLKGAFDFMYLPIDFRNKCGLGYAFVNFMTHADAVNCYKHFHNLRWDEFNSKKVCEVTFARVQGREALVQHFKTAKFPSSEAEYCPLVYQHASEDEVSAGTPRAHSPLPIHQYLESIEGGGDAAETEA